MERCELAKDGVGQRCVVNCVGPFLELTEPLISCDRNVLPIDWFASKGTLVDDIDEN